MFNRIHRATTKTVQPGSVACSTLWLITVTTVVIVFDATCSEASNIRTVVLSNVPIPKLGSGVQFTSFDHPAIDKNGNVWMEAGYRDSANAQSNKMLVRVDRQGNVYPLVNIGDDAPGLADSTYLSFALSEVTSDSDLIFTSLIDRPGARVGGDLSMWTVSPTGDLNLLTALGEEPPGAPIGSQMVVLELSAFASTSYSPSGFKGRLFGGTVTQSTDTGIWSATSGQLELIAREGDLVPIGSSQVTLRAFGAEVSTKSGQTVFGVRENGPPNLSPVEPDHLYSHFESQLNLLAKKQDTAPTLNRRGSFDVFGTSVPSGSGSVAFAAEMSLNIQRVDGSDDEGLWLYEDGQLDIIIQEGMHGPGLARPARLIHEPTPIFSGDGMVVFTTSLIRDDDGSSGQAVYKYSKGSGIELVFEAGQRAPGTDPNIIFSGGAPLVNKHGRLAIHARLEGPGIDLTNDWGIWAENIDGALELIAREGNELEIAEGVFETIRHLPGFGGVPNYLDATFNPRGDIVFEASLNSGTGVFVSSAVAVPEPGTACLVVMLALMKVLCKKKN